MNKIRLGLPRRVFCIFGLGCLVAQGAVNRDASLLVITIQNPNSTIFFACSYRTYKRVILEKKQTVLIANST